jgi:hypothetical protein
MPYEAIQYPMYQPAMRIITAITNATNALVTTSFDHQYISGTIVHLVIPQYYGMQQIYQNPHQPDWSPRLTITVVNATQFTVNLDTTTFEPFAYPPVIMTIDPITGLPVPLPPWRKLSDGTIYINELPQVVPFGEVTEELRAAVKNVLPYP